MANTALKTKPGSVFQTTSVSESLSVRDAWIKGIVAIMIIQSYPSRDTWIKGSVPPKEDMSKSRRIPHGMRGLKKVEEFQDLKAIVTLHVECVD